MLKKSFIIIPNKEHKYEICDFLSQTSRILAEKNTVMVVQLQESKSVKEIILSLLDNKKISLIEKDENNIYHYQPIYIIPFQRFEYIKKINLFINYIFLQILSVFSGNNEKYILWMFFPHIEYTTNFFTKKWYVIYDIIDHYVTISENENTELLIKKKKILKRADLISSISNTLKNKYKKLTNKSINIVPQGFSIPNNNNSKMKSIFANDKKIIGLVGGINERIDWNLIENIARDNINIDFVLLGPITHNPAMEKENNTKKILDIIDNNTNILHISKKSKEEVFNYINSFDICMIPYDISYDFNLNSYPMKVFEYFYMQKPVISTPILELQLKKFNNLIFIGGNYTEWNNHINRLTKGWGGKDKIVQRQMSLDNTWRKKIKKISLLISNTK